MAVIVPDNVKVVEESSTPEPKKPDYKLEPLPCRFEGQKEINQQLLARAMTNVNRIFENKALEINAEKQPAETLETKTETLETQSNTEKATETVENTTELNGNNVTAVILDTPNHDVIHGDKNHCIEKALKKFITSTTGIKYDESKKDKKPKETKSDLSVLEVCQKMNVTTHELREMINAGEFPQPDCDKKWSVKLLKKEGII